jgi:pimeloyl-[acyl-carrier protein] methyl ester esterase
MVMSVRMMVLAAAALTAFGGAGVATGVFSRAEAQTTASATDPNRLFADSKLIVHDRISVEVVGSGPDLIFVPGLASSRETWKRTAERLRGKYRLHLVQVAGFAGEPARANAAAPVLEPTAEAIDAYIVEAHLTPATYIGHSLGGTMGLYLAQHHPEHYRKVLLVDSLPFFGVLQGGPTATSDSLRPQVEKMRTQMMGGGKMPPAMLKGMAAGMAKSADGQQEIIDAGARGSGSVVTNAMAEDTLLDLRPGLPSMTTPITLIYPFDPGMGMPEATWDGLYKGQFAPLKTATLVRVDDSRHFVMFDQPTKFDGALDAFLAK